MNDVNERLCDCLDDAICEVVSDVNDVIDVTSLVDAQRQSRLTAMDAAAFGHQSNRRPSQHGLHINA